MARYIKDHVLPAAHARISPGPPASPARDAAVAQRLGNLLHMMINFGFMNVTVCSARFAGWRSLGTRAGAVSEHVPLLAGLDLQQQRHIQSERRSTRLGA